jgi:hypothetical protein
MRGKERQRIALWHFQMEALVTIVLLPACLYIILFGGTNPNQQWAIGVVGMICGYWLHSTRTPSKRI